MEASTISPATGNCSAARVAPPGHIYQLVLVPPSPLVSWNHRVRRKFWLWSLNLNDLRVRSLITNDLASTRALLSNSHVLLTPYSMKMVGSTWSTLCLSLCCYHSA